MKIEELIGQTYGRWTVIDKAPSKDGKARLLCKCLCGTVRELDAYTVTHGHTLSCGCLQKEHPNRKTHGKSSTHAHNIWRGIKARCYNPNNKEYGDYGGRNIAVCDKWRDSFEAFYNDVSKLPHFGEQGYTIDRIDTNGNYEPSNVRWATKTEQNRNKRNNINITYNGKTQCLKAWANELHMPYLTLYQRIKTLKWNVEKAFTTPIK